MKYLSLLIVGAALFMPYSANAAIVFDFESLSSTDSSDGYSLVQQSVNGLTATFTRSGTSFDIDDISSSGAPASFGARTLSPFADFSRPALFSAVPFTVSFSQGLQALSFEAGDFGGDQDTISLSIYSGSNGAGTLLKTVTYTYGSGSLPNDVAYLVAASEIPFQSAIFIGGSADFPNSVYYDNFSATVSAVPLPASLPLLAVAVLSLGIWGAISRRTASQR